MSVFLFPGQGSQAVGMGRDFYNAGSIPARQVFDTAAALAGPELLQAMFEGPEAALTDTRVAQPALLTADVAIARHLESRGFSPRACAGHSLGEFAALIVAGALSFETGFRLVQERARLMAEQAPEGGMAAVVGMEPETIESMLPDGAEIANYNGPQQTIITGTKEGLSKAEEILKAGGAKRVLPLPVSGPFHSSCMRLAAEAFRELVDRVSISQPACAVISSVTGEAVETAAAIRDVLARQMRSPVRWTHVMRTLGPVRAIECGPGKVLQGIARRTDNAPAVESAGTLESANALESAP
ncbi:MAG TPA: ACP S-malonyltransferase [Candidatus Hydrogenedentes bacterium]|nr:ACP S-malonyltransferase [Candidatus Hydrogenedentota bacterium]HOS03078.1 ACP S-malonyltransferase [Candidatus Hydrogenedentota bacterium]